MTTCNHVYTGKLLDQLDTGRNSSHPGGICGRDEFDSEHNPRHHTVGMCVSVPESCMFHAYQEAPVNPTAASALIQLRKVADDIEVLGQPMSARRLRDESVAIEAAFTPDIIFPDFHRFGPNDGGQRVPLAISVMVDGEEYRLVNWYNFLGWEVRSVTLDQSSGGPQWLGHITTGAGSGRSFAARTRNQNAVPVRKEFARVDEAIRFLSASGR